MSSPFLSKSSQLIMISIYTYNDIKYKLITVIDTYSKLTTISTFAYCLGFIFSSSNTVKEKDIDFYFLR